MRLGSIQQFEVSGPYGIPAGGRGPSGTVIGQQREILPGQSAVVRETVEGVWPVAQVVTDLSAYVEPVGDDELVGPLPRVMAQATVWAVPWAQLATLALLALLVVALVVLRRRRRRTLERRIAAARAAGAREALAGA